VNLEAIEKLADAVGLVTFVICLCGLIYYSHKGNVLKTIMWGFLLVALQLEELQRELAKPDRPVSEAKP
jgi:hypothetical protein